MRTKGWVRGKGQHVHDQVCRRRQCWVGEILLENDRPVELKTAGHVAERGCFSGIQSMTCPLLRARTKVSLGRATKNLSPTQLCGCTFPDCLQDTSSYTQACETFQQSENFLWSSVQLRLPPALTCPGSSKPDREGCRLSDKATSSGVLSSTLARLQCFPSPYITAGPPYPPSP